VFPLHTPNELAKLSSQWIRWRPITRPYEQPLTDIKDYFGERVGLYFAWLGFYTKWLMIPAFFGTIVQIWSLSVASGEKGEEYDPDIAVASVYGLMITIWCTLFTEFWKRNEAKLSMEWGTVGCETEEQERPEFRPSIIIEHSPIDGQFQKFFSPNTRKKLVTQSWVVISIGLVIVIGAVVGVIGFRYWATKLQCDLVTELPEGCSDAATCEKDEWWIEGNDGAGCVQILLDGVAAVPPVCATICDNVFLETNGATIASIMNAFQIQALGIVFKGIAEFLNNRENHRTDTEYTDALIAKEFLFQFVNSYAAVFYTGFVKGTILKGDSCIDADGLETTCFNELSQQLAIIFIIRLVSGNLTEIGIPTVMAAIKRRNELKNARKMATGDGGEAEVVALTDAEEEFALQEYDDKGIFADYSEMMVQFGYSTLFVTAFPFAPAMSLLNNYVEIRVDAMKLTRVSRRPFPRSAEDIGTWQTILEVMGTAAVISNVYLICFTSSQQSDVATSWKAWEFLILEHAVLGFKFALALLVPDAPEDVKIQIQRREVIEAKVLFSPPRGCTVGGREGVTRRGTF
jgi:anoctamin-10/anoctamin-7